MSRTCGKQKVSIILTAGPSHLQMWLQPGLFPAILKRHPLCRRERWERENVAAEPEIDIKPKRQDSLGKEVLTAWPCPWDWMETHGHHPLGWVLGACSRV